jgi:hypothetical protein
MTDEPLTDAELAERRRKIAPARDDRHAGASGEISTIRERHCPRE